LLDGPAVAVGVGEEHEPAPGEVLDLADLDPARRGAGAGGLDVGDDQLQAGPPTPAGVGEPGPRAIEQAEPGGVSWTKRSSSLTLWSWSALKPTCSV
jgi:hypothetical protein